MIFELFWPDLKDLDFTGLRFILNFEMNGFN
jgi:hypothetical protein